MIQFVCNICQKKLQKCSIGDLFHFCDRHQARAQEFINGYNQIMSNAMIAGERAVEKYRNQLLREEANPKPELKAV